MPSASHNLPGPEHNARSSRNLRRRGRHVQVGLMLGEHARPQVPMDKVIAFELEILGSHGMQAYRYPAMMEMIDGSRYHFLSGIGRGTTLMRHGMSA